MRNADIWKRCIAVGVVVIGVLGEGAGSVGAQYIDLQQGWSKTERETFWFGTQGSRIMLESWFLHLEQKDSTADKIQLLSDKAFLQKFGFISLDAYALPIGFAQDRDQSGTAHIGLTCAACHTRQLKIDDEGDPVIVEGGPALIDFSAFLDALVDSTAANLQDPMFLRFADRLKVPKGSERTRLRKELAVLSHELTTRRDQNRPTERYGFGRVDAFGHIFNRVLATATGVPGQKALPDAPVSYPALWDTSSKIHEQVQWNWSAPNAKPGDLVRNVGELLGVFGYFDITKKAKFGWPYYPKSSVRSDKLNALEDLIPGLLSPKWPSDRLPINPTLRADGEAIYKGKGNCISCHVLIDRESPTRTARDRLVPILRVGTDPRMTDNFNARMYEQTLQTGLLKGRVIVRPDLHDPLGIFGNTSSGSDILNHVLAGVIAGQFAQQDKGRVKPQEIPPPAPTQPGVEEHPKGYKARPLNGIWATAPYLHNGSVPTLRNLLKKDRGQGFWVGSIKLDSVDVGLWIQKGPSDDFFWLDTTKDGNRNTGHPFGLELTPIEQDALIEFLKTL